MAREGYEYESATEIAGLFHTILTRVPGRNIVLYEGKSVAWPSVEDNATASIRQVRIRGLGYLGVMRTLDIRPHEPEIPNVRFHLTRLGFIAGRSETLGEFPSHPLEGGTAVTDENYSRILKELRHGWATLEQTLDSND